MCAGPLLEDNVKTVREHFMVDIIKAWRTELAGIYTL
jgi:hypothetical protein